jgi:hypothetical protein
MLILFAEFFLQVNMLLLPFVFTPTLSDLCLKTSLLCVPFEPSVNFSTFKESLFALNDLTHKFAVQSALPLNLNLELYIVLVLKTRLKCLRTLVLPLTLI